MYPVSFPCGLLHDIYNLLFTYVLRIGGGGEGGGLQM